MQIELLIIDPQNDFSDVSQATLPIPGASADAARLVKLLDHLQKKITNIHITLDTHQLIDIAHPLFWRNKVNQCPAPFTKITLEDVQYGYWLPYKLSLLQRITNYLGILKSKNRYELTIWPPHCLIGQWGHNVMPILASALQRWEIANFKRINYLLKGYNPWTEQLSAIQAEVPDPEDYTTLINKSLLQALEKADLVLISGQALSHCVAYTIRDIAANFQLGNLGKLMLIEDTSSPVPGYEHLAHQFLTDMRQIGVRTVHVADLF